MSGDLFGHANDGPRPDVWYSPAHFPDSLMAALLAELPLRQGVANMYGKTIQVPRLECWFGVRPYSFGGRVEHPQPWTPELAKILNQLNAMQSYESRIQTDWGLTTETFVPTGRRLWQPFDSCFVNYYRDGNDAISWHADDDSWIGPVIASVSFGAPRRFVMRHNETKQKREWPLGNGDLLVMWSGVQQTWQHSVPRTKEPVGPRLNLTFRQTVGAQLPLIT